MADHCGSLTWNISGTSLSKFLAASNGDEFASDTFTAGSFTFQCKVYPNGRKREQRGCVMLYFVLQTALSPKMSKLTVKARLFCVQTQCDWKHIQHLKRDNARGIGWHSKNMLLSEAQSAGAALQLICEVTILRIEYKDSPQINIYHKLSRMAAAFEYKWDMTPSLLASLQSAHNGKFYHSSD